MTAKSPLQEIPGVGPNMAATLQSLGIHAPNQLIGQDAEALYTQLIANEGKHVDRCVLYVFRCAIYYASHDEHDSELLKWWRWKD